MFNIFEGTFLERFFPSYLFGLGFGGKKSSGGGGTVTPQPMMPSWQMGVGQDLAEWTSKYLKNYAPGEAYKGNMTVTAPSMFEQMGLGILGNTLSKPATGDLYNSAKGNIMDTLSGKFADPATSPFIQAATQLSKQNLQDQITTERGQRGARGTYFTKAGINAEGQLGERTQNNLNAIIGDYINQERGRQQQAVPMAQGLEQYAMDAPLKQVGASQTMGSLPRMLEQSQLDRMYQDYTRQRSELAGIPQVGSSVFNKAIPYGISSFNAPQQSGGGFMDQMAPFLGTAMQILPFLMGGCWVAAEIYGGFWQPKTTMARAYVNYGAPSWFKKFYLEYGQRIAKVVRKYPILKSILKPLFEIFATKGKKLLEQ